MVTLDTLPELPDCLRRWWPSRFQGMKRCGPGQWTYRGYKIMRNGRVFMVERIPGMRSVFADQFPTLRKAKAFVDWLAESKG